LSLVDADRSTAHVAAVHAGHGLVGIFRSRERDETESLGPARLAVLDDRDVYDFTKFFKRRA
jgi:hypothetical protein